MDLALTGKVAIVTGSSDGIGYAVARSLAREGARLVLFARRETLLAEARETIVKETGTEVLARKLVRFFDWPPTPHPVADSIDSGLKPGMVGANQRYAGHN